MTYSKDLIVSVFKTSISVQDEMRLKPVLDSWSRILKWNTDLEDCDNILRIESQDDINQDITTILHAHNLACVELQ
jgi:hypothetical protein